MTLVPKSQWSWSLPNQLQAFSHATGSPAVWFIPSDGRIIPYLPDTDASCFLMSAAARTPQGSQVEFWFIEDKWELWVGEQDSPFSTSGSLFVCWTQKQHYLARASLDLSHTQFLQSLGLILLAQRPREDWIIAPGSSLLLFNTQAHPLPPNFVGPPRRASGVYSSLLWGWASW